MTLAEYLFRMKAHALSRVDKERDMHLQALINRSANAREKKGNKEVYVYKNLEEFFDYEKRIASIEGAAKSTLSEQQKRMAEVASQVNK